MTSVDKQDNSPNGKTAQAKNDRNVEKKELDDEEKIRERLKQRQEARRRNSEPSAGNNPESEKPSEKEASANGSSSSKQQGSPPKHSRKRRRRRRRDRRRHRDGRGEERRPGPPGYYNGPPPGDWRGGRGGGPPHHVAPHGRWERDQRDWRGGRGGPPPADWRGGPLRGPPPPHYRGGDWGRRGPPRYRGRSRSRSRSSRSVSSSRSRRSSLSRSRSRSYSTSPSRSDSSRSSYSHDSRSRSRSRSHERRSHRHRRRRSPSYSDVSSDDASSASSSNEDEGQRKETNPSDALTKDQRTVLVSQLVMRTTERDVSRYFRKKVKIPVNDVILLRDKRTGRHKGIAYVELGRLEDVSKAIAMSGQTPDFQRFPILVKASEAEKNYLASGTISTMGQSSGPLMGPDGKLYEAQKAYVGNLDRTVTSEHIYAVFVHFGQLDKVALQMDTSTGTSRGFVFLSYRDPKCANLAIQAMSGQVLAGRPLKTGWASQSSSTPGVEIRTSDEFPDDAAARIQQAQLTLAQLQGTGLLAPGAAAAVPAVSSVAEAAINAALGLPAGAGATAPAVAPVATTAESVTPTGAATTSVPTVTPATAATTQSMANGAEDAKEIVGTLSKHILVRNMFDKDEETEDGWEEDIRLDFEEECSKYGKMDSVKVMSTEPGGKIYASFTTVDGAKTCALNLAGRWFDKRQLRVEYIQEEDLPK